MDWVGVEWACWIWTEGRADLKRETGLRMGEHDWLSRHALSFGSARRLG